MWYTEYSTHHHRLQLSLPVSHCRPSLWSVHVLVYNIHTHTHVATAGGYQQYGTGMQYSSTYKPYDAPPPPYDPAKGY